MSSQVDMSTGHPVPAVAHNFPSSFQFRRGEITLSSVSAINLHPFLKLLLINIAILSVNETRADPPGICSCQL